MAARLSPALAGETWLRAAALRLAGGPIRGRRQMQFHAAAGRQASAVQCLVQVAEVGLQKTQRRSQQWKQLTKLARCSAEASN